MKIGNGSAITELRKACQMNINVMYPAGSQYSISDLTYRGTALLDGGVNGVHNTAYYFSGSELLWRSITVVLWLESGIMNTPIMLD